jgi:hypothetical protein
MGRAGLRPTTTRCSSYWGWHGVGRCKRAAARFVLDLGRRRPQGSLVQQQRLTIRAGQNDLGVCCSRSRSRISSSTSTSVGATGSSICSPLGPSRIPLLPPGSGHLNPFREQALTKSAGRAERQVRSLGMRPAIHAGGVHCEPSGLRNLSPMSRVTLRWWYTRWMTSARSCGYSCPAVTSSCPR